MDAAAHTPTADLSTQPEPPRTTSPAGIVVAAVIAVGIVGLALLNTMFVLPRFIEILATFDTELPWPTALALNHGGIWVVVAALLASTIMVLNEVLLYTMNPSPAIRWMLRMLMVLILVLFAVLLLVSLVFPIMAIMNSLH